MINKVLCKMGAMLILCAFLAWLVFSSGTTFSLTSQEAMSIVFFGFMLMLPELNYQLKEFLSSSRRYEEEFMN